MIATSTLQNIFHNINHSLIRGADAGRYPRPPATTFFPSPPPLGRDGGLDVFCLLLLTSPSGPLPPNLSDLVLDEEVGRAPPDRKLEPERALVDDPDRKFNADRGLPLYEVFLPGSFV